MNILISSVITWVGCTQRTLLWRVAFFAALPLFMLVIMPLSHAYSRLPERRADEFVLKATGKG